jgi:hypothetical protein
MGDCIRRVHTADGRESMELGHGGQCRCGPITCLMRGGNTSANDVSILSSNDDAGGLSKTFCVYHQKVLNLKISLA